MENTASAALFVGDSVHDSLEEIILEQVKGFYKEIANLICAYLYCRLQVGQIVDVYDERDEWIIGSVVALRKDYVGIHYNGFNCQYDDWIHCESFRLAPLNSYTWSTFCSNHLSHSKEYKLGNQVYNEFLRSISPGYRDRLKPAHLSKYISTLIPQYQPAKSEQQNLVEALSALESYNQSLGARLHRPLLEFQYVANPDTYRPPSARLYDRATLERKACAYQAKFRPFDKS